MGPNEIEVALRQMESGFKNQLSGMQQQLEAVKAGALDIDQLAGKRIPYRIQVDIEVAQAANAILSGTRTLTLSGPFVAKRLTATFRIKSMQDGGSALWVGRYLPLSSRNVYSTMQLFKVNAGSLEEVYEPPLDFEWSYTDGGTDRARQDQFIAGDVLARYDDDGFMPVSDIFAGGATITFKINPLRAVGNGAPWSGSTGVDKFEFNAIFEGYRILQPLSV